MREVPDDEHGAWVRAMRERARLDAEELVPRPGHLVYGLAAPALRPAALEDYTRVNGESTSVTVAYGAWDSPEGPYVQVITSATDATAVPTAGSTTISGEHGEASLRFAVDEELDRPTTWADEPDPDPDPEPEPAGPLAVSRETLPVGEALVCRDRIVWAARLVPADADGAVVVTIIGRGLAPESVLLQPVTDLRPMVEARNEIIGARIERARRLPRPPLPELEPAEGVAALLALVENTLAEHALAEHRETQPTRRRDRRRQRELERARLRAALWQRAAREHQRLRGTDRRAADDAVTVAVNHLGFLLENAPWFSADPRLRAKAVNETARHTMLADAVPSEAAQAAWARSWSARESWLRADPDTADLRATHAARRALTDACLLAWAAWADAA